MLGNKMVSVTNWRTAHGDHLVDQLRPLPIDDEDCIYYHGPDMFAAPALTHRDGALFFPSFLKSVFSFHFIFFSSSLCLLKVRSISLDMDRQSWPFLLLPKVVQRPPNMYCIC